MVSQSESVGGSGVRNSSGPELETGSVAGHCDVSFEDMNVYRLRKCFKAQERFYEKGLGYKDVFVEFVTLRFVVPGVETL